MAIRWREDYKTGIELIDFHHESMFEKINELLGALDRGEEIATIRISVIFFESFLASHFTLEEMLMKKFDCPDFSSHSRQHSWLSEYLSGLIPLIETKGTSPDFVTSAGKLIKGWWKVYTSHLNSSDKQLAEFLKTKL